jgi:hypothetical protein
MQHSTSSRKESQGPAQYSTQAVISHTAVSRRNARTYADVCRKMLTYADACRKVLQLGPPADTPDAEAQQALRNASRFLTLSSNVCHAADANANGLMHCERHARTVIIFAILLPAAVSSEPVALPARSNSLRSKKNKKPIYGHTHTHTHTRTHTHTQLEALAMFVPVRQVLLESVLVILS